MLEKRLIAWQNKQLTRLRHITYYREYGNNHIVIQNKGCVNFSSNDYLGLIQHPLITSSMIEGIKKYGVGSGSSAMVSGYSSMQENLEETFAQWLKMDRAILFNCGYMANLGIMTSLLSRKDTVVSDKLCHASLLDGIQLSRAKHYRYKHNDMGHLQKMVNDHKPTMIVTESIFSMQGDIAPIVDIVKMAKQSLSELVIDDAHGIGVLGENGRGILEYNNLKQDQFSCAVIPLGKAFNAMGAMVVGRADIIDAILQFSRSYRYSTALPPAICHALQSALNIIKIEPWRRYNLNKNIAFFNTKAMQKRLPLINQENTPIRMMMIGDNKKTMALQQSLWHEGLYVAAIRQPTVSSHKACLRISLNCFHTEENMECLLDKMAGYLS